MSCYRPLKGFPIGLTDNGKTDYYITSYECDHVEIDGSGHKSACFTSTRGNNCKKYIRDFIQIPCGRCIGCRLDYSRQWADRCMLELGYHDESWFVTLTYDEENLPLSESLDMETGEIVQHATLVKRDLQLFLKRLRKAYDERYPGKKIRYYACGEYGSNTFRPHYHIIIFGLHLDDIRLYRQSPDGYHYYNSDWLDKRWKKGFAVLGRVNWDTCAYTARYILKKQYGFNAQVYKELNITPEFTTMSLKPAIGRQYFEDHKDSIYDTDCIYIGTEEGSRKIIPPKYFDKKTEELDADLVAGLKEKRREYAQYSTELKNKQTDKSFLERLETEEFVKTEQIKALKRKEF